MNIATEVREADVEQFGERAGLVLTLHLPH